MLKDGDSNWSTDEGQLQIMASTFFENLYMAEEGPIPQYHVRGLFPKLTAIIQTTALPKSLCNQIEVVVKKFIWGQGSGNRKISLVSWTDMCMPYDPRESGLQSIHK